MDRGLYLRFAVVVASAILAGLQLWPTIDDWRAGGDPDARTAPEWVGEWFPGRISPGLDIRGGLRLQYEVEVEEYIRDRRDTLSEQLVRKLGVLLEVYGVNDADTATREQLATVAEQVQVATLADGLRATVTFTGSIPEGFDRDWLRDEGFGEMRIVPPNNGNVVLLEMREDNLDAMRATAVLQAQHTVEERINTLGIAETTVMARETDIVVEVPGATEEQFERIRSIIARTARLEFKVLDDEGDYVSGLRDTLPEGVTMLMESTSAGEERPNVTVNYLYAGMNDGEESSVAAFQRLEAYVDTLDVPTGHELLLGEVGGPTDRVRERG